MRTALFLPCILRTAIFLASRAAYRLTIKQPFLVFPFKVQSHYIAYASRMQILVSVCTFQKNVVYPQLLIPPLDYRPLQMYEYRIHNV